MSEGTCRGYLGEDLASLIADEADIDHMVEYYRRCIRQYKTQRQPPRCRVFSMERGGKIKYRQCKVLHHLSLNNSIDRNITPV